MVNEALTKSDCCLNFANNADEVELVAKATALMATIQFEQEPLEDEEKEMERLKQAKETFSKFSEALKRLNELDGEPTEKWCTDAKDLRGKIDAAIDDLEAKDLTPE